MQYTDTILATPSDTHSGSPVGLLPPGQWQFTNGGYHDPDGDQRLITALWVRSWERVAEARKGKRLVIVHVGDATEGRHHDTTQLITVNVEEQERIHLASMDLALKIAGFDHHKGDLLYYVKGTPAHVGQGGRSEERIAREYAGNGVVPKVHPTGGEDGKDGRFLWDRLRLKINGKLFDIAHHGAGLGTKPWTKTNPLRSKLQEIYWRTMENKEPCPDVWLRAHRHVRAYDSYVGGNGHQIQGFITPAFQARTEFGYKVAADQVASMGMLWFEITAGGAIRHDGEFYEVEQDRIEAI